MISDWLDPGKFDILLLNAITILTWKKENLKNHKDPYSTFNIKNLQCASFSKVTMYTDNWSKNTMFQNVKRWCLNNNPDTVMYFWKTFSFKHVDIPFEINSCWPFLTLTQSQEYLFVLSIFLMILEAIRCPFLIRLIPKHCKQSLKIFHINCISLWKS